MKVIAFYQAIGAGLPVLVGIFTASVMEQEQNAGNFQSMLSLSKKGVAFISKLLLLLMLCLGSVLLTTLIFGTGFGMISASGSWSNSNMDIVKTVSYTHLKGQKRDIDRFSVFQDRKSTV